MTRKQNIPGAVVGQVVERLPVGRDLRSSGRSELGRPHRGGTLGDVRISKAAQRRWSLRCRLRWYEKGESSLTPRLDPLPNQDGRNAFRLG